jgi:hypothetical protein
MFDTVPSDPRDAALVAAQCVFFDHGHRLANAARFVGGPSAEARVVDLGVRLTHASRMTHRLRRDLVALHRLLALEEVSETDDRETLILAGINLASSRIEEICLLTDLLQDLLETTEPPPLHLPPASRPAPIKLPAQVAA